MGLLFYVGNYLNRIAPRVVGRRSAVGTSNEKPERTRRSLFLLGEICAASTRCERADKLVERRSR
jgi:hypothetical protein